MKNIRNFAIISHIDHGKSTLADRLLEITNTVPKEKMRDQLLDQMDLEREKGITIKLQPVRMEYKGYVLNLIDTPGHIDFCSEVERSLKAVEGVVLLVDATKGIQAQTLTNLYLAQKQNLVVIPVINKIDLPNACIEKVEEELINLLKIEKNRIIKISAKTGQNVEKLLEEIIKSVPPPKGNPKAPLKILIFDSFYDPFKGVIAYIRVLEGTLRKEKNEIGVFKPQMVPVSELGVGEVGYLATGQKNLEEYLKSVGWKIPQSMVFASLYPTNEADFSLLKEALNRLKLNDPALYFEEESLPALGRGFRCGFLGTLHLEIVVERLKREYQLDLLVTTPQVNYQINRKDRIAKEPWVELKIITPQNYLGKVMELLKQLRGEYKKTDYLSKDRLIIEYNVALADILINFYDRLKSVSSGYASMIYTPIESRKADLVKLEVFVAGQQVSALSQIVPREYAQKKARKLAVSLKELIPRQNFAVPIQIALGDIFQEQKTHKPSKSRIIARETIPALRKDVLAPLYGGDYTRKKKLLQKQRKGKKKLAARTKVNIPNDVFIKLLRKQ
ncbi:translation elongation factor 4 [bacterium]|nr:translation elongation factor 4 [bacterium]